MNGIAPIRDEAGYDTAIGDIRRLWGAAPGTPDGDRLDVLMILVEAYENDHHVIEPPDPIEAIKQRMADLGLSRADLGELPGIASGRISEILNRRRRMTPDMMRRLASGLKLSEACLLQQYELAAPSKASRLPRRAAVA